MWDKLETFYYVVKAGSFTKAEDVLHKSQSALSRTVGQLEHRLGHRLLNRKIKGLTLTRKGEEVFRTAQHMVMDFEGMRTSLNEQKGMTGKIRISTTHAIGNYILSDPLIDFSRKYPEIDIDLICNDQLIDIVQNDVDVAIRPYMENKGDSHRFIQEHLFTLTAGLYASPEYLKEFGHPKVPEDLDNHRLLIRSRAEENPYSNVSWVLTVGRGDQAARKPFYTSNSTPNLLSAAEKGIGITIGYQEMKNVTDSNLIQILPNIESPSYEDYLIYPKHLENIEKIKILKEHLIKVLKG